MIARLPARFIDHSIQRCSLFRCERQVVAQVGARKVCAFHFALLTACRSEMAFREEERNTQRGNPNFGLSLEDESELENPGDAASKR